MGTRFTAIPFTTLTHSIHGLAYSLMRQSKFMNNFRHVWMYAVNAFDGNDSHRYHCWKEIIQTWSIVAIHRLARNFFQTYLNLLTYFHHPLSLYKLANLVRSCLDSLSYWLKSAFKPGNSLRHHCIFYFNCVENLNYWKVRFEWKTEFWRKQTSLHSF